MKKYLYLLLLGFTFTCFTACQDDKICTTCTEAISNISTSFCDVEQEVIGFENAVISQAMAGEIWTCVRN